MAGIDWVIIAAFFVLIFGAGVFFYKWVANADDFYVAGRQLTPFILAATLTATNVNLYSFIGQAGQASAAGIGMIWQTWTGNMSLVLAGLFIVPVLRRLKVRTVPEFLEDRYGRSARILVAAAIFLRLAFWLGIVLNFAVTVAIAVTGLNEVAIGGIVIPGWYFWVVVFAAITIVYTVVGGMWSVALTDVLQFVFMLVGALIVLPLIMAKVGWWPGLQASLMQDPATAEHLTLVTQTGKYNWMFILAIMVLGIQWASTDQGLIQRAFGAKDTKTVAKGMVLAGIITTPFAFLWILPGLASRVFLAQQGIDVPPDQIIPTTLTTLLPAGVLGLVLCGLLAAQMSTIDSNLSACATLFVNDIYGRIRKQPPDTKKLLGVVRFVTLAAGVFMVLFAYLLVYVIKQESGVSSYLGLVAIFDMPLFVVVVLFGFFSRWANLWGALLGYLVGAIGGSVTMFLTGVVRVAQADGVVVEGIGPILDYASASALGITGFIGSGDGSLATFISGGAAIVGVLLGSLIGKRPDPEKVALIQRARHISQEEIDANDIYHIWPQSFAGRLSVLALALAFLVFLAGIIIGKYSDAGSAVAVMGMIIFFLAGLVRLAFK